ncbi:MAG: transcription antitermination protein NusB [Proteobacteria bacterium]|nr:transcription antitermination protein NusB [Pseudomonadota bacterium]
MSDSPSQPKAIQPNSGLRREGREAAIQFLFQRDFQTVESTHDKAANLPVELPVPEPDFWKLRNGAADPDELNPLPARGPIAPKARALRLAVFEIIHASEVPPVVAINEAIELAKQFGSEDSGRFVNGLLDKVRAEFPRAARQAARAVVEVPEADAAPSALEPDPLPTPV